MGNNKFPYKIILNLRPKLYKFRFVFYIIFSNTMYRNIKWIKIHIRRFYQKIFFINN